MHMRGPIGKIKAKINTWRKTRQLRKKMAEAQKDLEFWSAITSPSGHPEVITMIERNQAEARSRITAA